MGNAQSWGLLAMLSPLLGCSLMGLDDFGVTPCISNDDCKKAESKLKPTSSACGAAVCEQELCKWQEAREVCNGEDDDCDGLIDEDLLIPAHKSSYSADEPAIVGYSVASDAGQTFVAVATGDSSHLFTLAAVAGDSGHKLQYASNDQRYNFTEIALAADATHLVVASINTLGCSSGQVHVGLSVLEKPFEVDQDKAENSQSGDESNIASGVDLDGENCTGASRDAGGAGASSHGATHPAVASLGTEANGKGALLAWLGTSARPRDTASEPIRIPVEALALNVPESKPVWLNGANRGAPIPLGDTTSFSAPAVLAVKRSGKYLVAFPTETGIRLLSVRPDRSLPPGVASLGFLPVTAVHQVSLALGNAERNEVGVAWRTGVGPDAQACFTVLSNVGQLPATNLATATILPMPALVCKPAATGSIGLNSAPQLLYRPAGFAEDGHPGGWFMSWVDAPSDDSRTFHVSRAREETSNILGDSPRPLTGLPLLYASDGNDDERVGYASIHAAAGDQSQAETIPRWCE
jgi:hypothetical protein